MKNIETILADAQIELTDEQKESVTSGVLENYITKAEHTKKLDKANAETEKANSKLEETNKALEGFKGESEKYESTIKELNEKIEAKDKEFNTKWDARDRHDAIESAVSGINFSSLSAKKSIIAEIQSKNLPVQKNEDGTIQLVGVNDVIDNLKKEDPNAFSEESKKGKFTSPKGKGGEGTITKEDIIKIKNPVERKEQIAKHKDLFEKE